MKDNTGQSIPMPGALEYYTADEVAETVDYHKHLSKGEAMELCRKLWGFLAEAKSPTPLGGDGSDGTVETPDGRLDLDNDDKAAHWWGRLDQSEQAALVKAMGN
jgi:hypothetical protein